MSDPKFIVIRHEVASAAIESIKSLYASMIADIQSVKDGSGNILKPIHWGASAPNFLPVASGDIPQWTHQEITLELMASVDYNDRTLDARYNLILQVLEDFCARSDLQDMLSNEYAYVETAPTFETGSESIENGRFITRYLLNVRARGRFAGE